MVVSSKWTDTERLVLIHSLTILCIDDVENLKFRKAIDKLDAIRNISRESAFVLEYNRKRIERVFGESLTAE